MILSEILRKHSSYDKLSVHYQKIVCKDLLLYLFRGITASEMNTRLTQILPDARAIDIRSDITNNGYILKNCKLYLHNMATNRNQNCRNYVKRTDRKLSMLLSDKELYTAITTGYVDIRTGEYTNYSVLSLEGLNANIATVMKRVDTFTIKFVHRKMRFLFNGSLSAEDIKHDLLYSGLRGILLFYPRIESMEHAVNLAKRSIHNSGINLIKWHTSGCRTRFGVSQDGTSTNLVSSSEGLLSHLSYSMGNTTMDAEGQLVGVNMSESDSIATSVDAVRLIERDYKRNRRKKKAVLLYLMGFYDKNFTTFLQEKGVTQQTNDEYYSRLMRYNRVNKYLEQVFEYCGVPKKNGFEFIESLRDGL